MVEYYHRPLRQVYSIITIKIFTSGGVLVLQISFKAMNNLMRPNKLVLILLVFSRYPRITELDVSFLLII